MAAVKRRQVKWYGHVRRSSGLAKTILQGTVQGGRQRGRQRIRWEDNIKEWTGLQWNIMLRKAKNREEWRKLIVKSTVVPQRSARLRDTYSGAPTVSQTTGCIQWCPNGQPNYGIHTVVPQRSARLRDTYSGAPTVSQTTGYIQWCPNGQPDYGIHTVVPQRLARLQDRDSGAPTVSQTTG